MAPVGDGPWITHWSTRFRRAVPVVLGLLLVHVARVQAQQWVRAAEAGAWIAQVDTETWTRARDIVTVWERLGGKDTTVFVSRVQYDCLERQSRTGQTLLAGTPYVSSDNKWTLWSAVIPGTLAAGVLKYVCSHVPPPGP